MCIAVCVSRFPGPRIATSYSYYSRVMTLRPTQVTGLTSGLETNIPCQVSKVIGCLQNRCGDTLFIFANQWNTWYMYRRCTGVITFELCDLWRYSLTKFMQNTMRAHSAEQISMEGGVDVNKGHMVYMWLLEPDNISHTQSMVAKRGRTNRANVHNTPMWKSRLNTAWQNSNRSSNFDCNWT